MMPRLFLFLLFIAFTANAFSQDITQPTQPLAGPGGANYNHQEVRFLDYAQDMEGYWLFEPEAPRPKQAHVIVFLHGYGAYNPMVYGEWIRHLVRKGNTVIFPRYQENMLLPLPTQFADNSAKAIKEALNVLTSENHVDPLTTHLTYVGHSFGGAIAANLATNYESFGLPKPAVAMLCSPGTGWVAMGQLESYENMPEDIKLLITVSEHDNVVGDEFGQRIFDEAIHTKDRNLIRQFADRKGAPRLSAYHNETYSLRTEYDSGHRSTSSIRALRISKLDAMDFYGYWKWLDALMDCSRNNNNCEYALGNTPEQRQLGQWSDKTPIKEVKVYLPN